MIVSRTEARPGFPDKSVPTRIVGSAACVTQLKSSIEAHERSAAIIKINARREDGPPKGGPFFFAPVLSRYRLNSWRSQLVYESRCGPVVPSRDPVCRRARLVAAAGGSMGPSGGTPLDRRGKCTADAAR